MTSSATDDPTRPDDRTRPDDPTEPETPHKEPLWARIDRTDLIRTLVVVGFAVVAGTTEALGAPFLAVAGIGIVGLFVGCWPVLSEAWKDIRHRRMSMELSMLIAIAAAAAIGQWVTALVIAAFVLAAEILEDLSMDRGRGALTDLMSALPSRVQIRDGNGLRTIEAAELEVGQVVVVSPGAGVPVDGVVVAGRSSLDQSRITGESLPVDVEPGSTVYAGSVNQVGAVEVRAERIGRESSYGRIVQAVQQAQSAESPAQRLADRFAAWLVYAALIGAAATFLITRDLRSTISVVVVAGACGIAAGTPLAILAAIARAARSGAFVKGGAHLETLSAIDTVVFDKTGTLTAGRLEVVDVRPAPGFGEAELVGLAAAAEWYSEHPLGQAIVARAERDELSVSRPDRFDYEPGYGLTAHVDGREIRVGNPRLVPESGSGGGAAQPDGRAYDRETARATTPVHVAVDQAYAGVILLADTIRESAAACVAHLHGLGLRVVMITGDNRSVAEEVGRRLGIDDVRAELLPAQKLEAVAAERAEGHRVAMVGDGVNDAPALAEANVGIAMGSGTQIARETADVVLISADPADLTRTIRIARRARRIVLANVVGTLAVDLIGMVLAGLGLLGPLVAAIVHVGSESAFILNSARLVPGRRAARARR